MPWLTVPSRGETGPRRGRKDSAVANGAVQEKVESQEGASTRAQEGAIEEVCKIGGPGGANSCSSKTAQLEMAAQ